MDKAFFCAMATAAMASAFAAQPAATAVVTVDPAKELGPIRDMNSVNGGPKVAPVLGDQKLGNFETYRALSIPMARTHDCVNCVSGGAHACDIRAIFPDFEADENDPRNYDFVFTDHYLDNMIRAGTKPFFRLGQTIEHGPKKYGVLPPKDFAKWARVCEHVIRHYNEGWGWATDTSYTTKNLAWSNQFDIAYWEIWNEPDLDISDNPNALPNRPRCWGGTVTNFFQLYETAAKHLKTKFPNLKIGGPASCGREDWCDRFLQWCEDRKAPLDFFSWHVYAVEPRQIVDKCARMRKMLDRHGFAKTESILNEWNYVKGWVDDWVYSIRVESGDLNLKGAAFTAATMSACQDAPVDMLMYYDARTATQFNGMFERVELAPIKGYYPFYAWGKLRDLGTQVGVTVTSSRKGGRASWATAAKGANGRRAVFVVRYSEDDNVSDTAELTLALKGGAPIKSATCHVTDDIRSYTEVPPVVNADGSVSVRLRPLASALIEF